jgi:hypothetical protein
LHPSAEEATETQLLLGALVCVHVWAKAEFKPHESATSNSRILRDFIATYP